MKARKRSFVLVLAILSFVIAAVFVSLSKPALVSAEEDEEDRPAACAINTPCTGGQTCCWKDTAGSHQATCGNNNRWGPTIDCGKWSTCTKNGPGGRCQWKGGPGKAVEQECQE